MSTDVQPTTIPTFTTTNPSLATTTKPTYTLTTDELQYCIRIGNERQDTNTRNRIPSKQFTSRDPTNIHIQGVIGEYSFAKLCGEDEKLIRKRLDNTQSRGARNDILQDCIVNGKTIDVKTTLNARAQQIYARLHKIKNPAHFYVLVLIEFLDPSTHQTIAISQQYYDQVFGLLQSNTRQFEVRCTFQGFASGTQVFAHYVQDNSYSCKVNSSWQEFSDQISATSSSNNKKESETCENGLLTSVRC